MALKFTNREVDGVAVEALDGRIVLGEESNALREKAKNLVAEGKKKIVLNMDNVTFIDSAGLGTLVAAHHSASPRAPPETLPPGQQSSRKSCRSPSSSPSSTSTTPKAEAVASFDKPSQ